MATLREIKRRIASVKSTQQITKAMKMVAAAKLRKSQQLLAQTRPFANETVQIVSALARKARDNRHPLMLKRKPRRVCYVLVAADRGLCGSFNSNLIRTAKLRLANSKAPKTSIVTIGKKGYDSFRRMDVRIAGKYVDFFNNLTFKDALKIADGLMDLFRRKKFDRVYVIYNEFQSIVQQRIVVKQFLPVVPAKLAVPTPQAMIFEPQPAEMLDELLPISLRYEMYRILLESFTAEQGARMTAMETASDNAEDMIKNLVLYYNKARQAAITKELNEIVSGAEALKG